MINSTRIIKLSLIPLIIKALTALLSLLLSYLASQKLSTLEFGLFSLAQVVVLFIVTFAKFGFDSAIVKNTAVNLQSQHFSLLKARYLKVSCLALIFVTLLCSTLYIFKVEMFHFLIEQPLLIELLIPIIVMSYATCFSSINSGLLKGLNATAFSVAFSGFTSLLIATFLFLCFSLIDSTAKDLLYLLATASLLACIFSFIVCHLKLTTLKNNDAIELKQENSIQLIKSSFPLWTSSIVYLLIPQFSFTLLSIHTNLNDIGIYAIALKVATAMTLILFAINAVLAPHFAQLYKTNNKTELLKLIKSCNKILIMCSVVLGFILISLANKLLLIFGTEFQAGTLVLQILILGQSINVGTGSVVNLLIMTGHERLHQKITLFTAILTVSVGFILIPDYTTIGAAITTSFGIALQNLLSLYFVKRRILNFEKEKI